MGRGAAEIVLSQEEVELKRWRRRRNTLTGLHTRAGIVLDCARGFPGDQIAERHQTSQQSVSKWRRRFAGDRLAGLFDTPRSGQPRRDWSRSSLAKSTSTSRSTSLRHHF